MRNVFNGFSEIPETTRAEYKRAISDWVESLPRSEAEAASVFVSGVGYSPLQILEEINQESEIGKEFLSGLFALSRHLSSKNKSASIVGLIRRSI